MSEKMKVRLNGKEIDMTKNKKNQPKKTNEEYNLATEDTHGEISFVKGLATGESIHWVLME